MLALLSLFGWPLTGRLAKPHSGAAAILIDEFDALFLKGCLYLISSVGSPP
jgi:hypothetical protein